MKNRNQFIILGSVVLSIGLLLAYFGGKTLLTRDQTTIETDEPETTTESDEEEADTAADSNSNLNRDSYYDPVNEGAAPGNTGYDGLSSEQTFSPSTLIFQTFDSGQAIKLELPMLPFAVPTIIDQGEIQGLQIKNDDYDLRIFHLLGLDDPDAYCSGFVSEGSIASLFPDASNVQDIETSNAQSMKYEFTSPTGIQVIGIRYCAVDSTSKVWVLEMFSSKTIFEQEYDQRIIAILDSFEFTEN